MKLPLETARALAIRAQGLDGGWRLPLGKEGVAQTVERLGAVQIDTIAVVERAHHHILWSRRPDHSPDMLHELQAKDRRVFEYWMPAAAYVPMRDYRFCLPRMRAERKWRKGFLRENAKLHKLVMSRIRAEGALRSSDFEAPEGKKRGSWWDWKPAKQVLEILFNMGELMVSRRESFQRLYDLPERVLPAGLDTREPAADELARFIVRRELGCHGILSPRELRRRHHLVLGHAFDELVESGEAVRVQVEGADGEVFYALNAVDRVTRTSRSPRVQILSPFDPLVINRQRTRRLFGFDCKLECYTPEPKRIYGYFCLPILWGRQFVGRMDSKADRGARRLIVRKLSLECAGSHHEALLPALRAKLRQFAAFNGCDSVTIERASPAKACRVLGDA